jgi:hypothetical protein
MKIFKLILIIGAALIISNCAYNKIDLIPMAPPIVKADFGNPFPFETGLLIYQKTREQVFLSPSIPDILNQYYWRTLEPYQLPVGQTFEEASIQIFSRIFPKIHLIRSLEEGQKYPLIIEPKLLDFDFHLRYATISQYISYQVFFETWSQAKVLVTLKIHDRPIWQNTAMPYMIHQSWYDDYYLINNVGQQASETITQALGKVAVLLLDESRKPQTVRGWLNELHPEAQDPARPPETKK